MCHHSKKSPPPKRKLKITSNVSVREATKTRTKRKKQKYLSLSSKLTPQKNHHHQQQQQSSSKKKKKKKKTMTQKLQLNLLPLHPEKQVELEMLDQEENKDVIIAASFLFDTATDSTTTLDGILTVSEESPLSPPMVTYGNGDCSNYGLVRKAMRCKERDASEERWVSYSEVVDSKKKKKKMEIKEEEGSSCIVDDDDDYGDGYDDDDDDDDASVWRVKQGQRKRKLFDLKLDYQEILNAWSDKGPLFVDGETPQIVPDLLEPNMLTDAWGNGANLWSVPEMTGNISSFKVDELGCKDGWNREHREASVLRYKEKRQNRLFAKRIRYEVRKLNAEKRPRMKGRFVKRNSEA